MAGSHSEPRALFLFMDSEAKPDTEVCSGIYPSHLKGEACPFSDHGRMPLYIESGDDLKLELNSADPKRPDPLSCMLQKLGRLEQWQKEVALIAPKGLTHKMVYRCRQMFLLVLLQ